METIQTYLSHLSDIFSSLFSITFLKYVFVSSFIFIEFMFGAENAQFINAIIGLVMIDFCVALFAAYKTGEAIESKKMSKTIAKIGVYSMMISSAHLLQDLISFQTFAEQAVIAVIGATEFISIMEKFGKAGYIIPKKLLNKLREIRDNT